MDNVNQNMGTVNADDVTLKSIILRVKQWWFHVLTKWKIVLLLSMVGAAVGLFYSIKKKTVYKAVLTFALQSEKSGGMNSALSLASQFGLGLGSGGAGGEFSDDNIPQLMQSRYVIEQTLLTPVVISNKTQTLADYFIDFNKYRDAWKGNPKLENVHFLPNDDRALYNLTQDSLLGVFTKQIVLNYLSVDKLNKNLSIIQIEFKSTDELFSKLFVEVLAKSVSDFYIRTKTKKEAHTVEILQRQTDSVRRVLNYAITGVASSLDAAPNANPALQSLRVPSQRKQIDVQANTAILTELVRNLELAKMSVLQETPLIQVIDRPILPLDIERLSKPKGLLFGGFAGAFLAIFVITLYRLFKVIMS